MPQIYVTHCSHKKNDQCRITGESVLPDVLYTARPTQRFMHQCKIRNVHRAIFSDLYGIWLPHIRHEWYEKDPNSVTSLEFTKLLCDFDEKLSAFSEILFYYNPGRFHPLYDALLRTSSLTDRVKRITHLREIA